jgi:hypothetical protein
MIDLVRRRLANQHLLGSSLGRPEDVVRHLGAVQAQDYSGAKWALGMRAAGTTDANVEQAFNTGAILRTHVLRPTWHFVSATDIRWLLTLSAPRVHAFNAFVYRTVELDTAIFRRSRRIFERVLRDGQHLTRAELRLVLRQAGIRADGLRLAYVMMQAELDQVICSGPRQGEQFTYALLDERVPKAQACNREEALAELVRRYFASHGPATLRDFVWWSGMTVRDARAGIDLVRDHLEQLTTGGLTYWHGRPASAGRGPRIGAHLLPNYDEYLIAYKDRGPTAPINGPARAPFPHHLIIDGRLAGSWKRTITGDTIRVEVKPYQHLTAARAREVSAVVRRYGAFVDRKAILTLN